MKLRSAGSTLKLKPNKDLLGSLVIMATYHLCVPVRYSPVSSTAAWVLGVISLMVVLNTK